MMRDLVDDLERYLNPQTHTPSRHDPVEQTNAFYIIDDNVYIAESLASELAARRNTPLLVLDDTTTFPDALYTTPTAASHSFLDFLDASTHREVIVCISDTTTLTRNTTETLAELVDTTTFTRDSCPHQPLLEDTQISNHITGSSDNLIFLAGEPGDTYLNSFSDTLQSHFGVQVDPTEHDGYSDTAFTRL